MTTFKKPPTTRTLPKNPRPLLECFALLFYVLKFSGINSQDLKEFRKFKQLKKSPTGEGIVIGNVIILIINYNLMISVFQTGVYIEEKDNLAIGIAFILTYFSLVLILTDSITGIIKQDSFAKIFHEMQEIDEDFLDLGIVFNNIVIKYHIVSVIIVTGLTECILFLLSFVLYVEYQNWTAFLWIYTSIPTYLNTVHKLWYAGILYAIRKRFVAINQAFEEEALKWERKEDDQRKLNKNKKNVQKNKNFKLKTTLKNQIKPALNNNINNLFGDKVSNSPIFSTTTTFSILADTHKNSSNSVSTSSNIIITSSEFCNLEDRFTKLCQLHASLCQVGKRLNDVFGFPILMLMGYGFLIITAHLYFMYCSRFNEAVPIIFRSSENWLITITYILYVGYKFVNILFSNWKTTLEAKKTGVCIHRCALAANQNSVYELVNHLSLKLYNHELEFNACGYFSLNMSTLFSYCGGISTYLIILIQFNLEERQAKLSTNNAKPMTLTLDKSNAVGLSLFEYGMNNTDSGCNNVTTLFDVLKQFLKSYDY